jgi:hypothetical protein
MNKAKAKTKAKAKRESTGKKTSVKTAKNNTEKTKDANPAEMRRDITNIVKNELGEITLAVVGEAKKGQLATVKYLWEVSGVYPPAAEGSADRPEDDSLAQKLLQRLGLPEGPLPGSEDDDLPEKVVIPVAISVAPEPKKFPEGIGEGQRKSVRNTPALEKSTDMGSESQVVVAGVE